MSRLDVDDYRDLRGAMATTVELFAANVKVLMLATLIVVVPVTAVVDGLLSGPLVDGTRAQAGGADNLISTVAQRLLVPAVITAIHAAVMKRIVDGRPPELRDLGAILVEGLVGCLPAALTLLMYGIGVAVGVVLLVIPGVVVAIRWYFAPTLSVLGGLAPFDALKSSYELTRSFAWRCLGYLAAAVVSVLALALAVLVPIAVVTGLTGSDVPLVIARTIVLSAVYSLVALFTVVLAFDLRARNRALGRSV